ncbi:hypothetical protein H0X48_02055 [Candidatus Dependentiae bacterium]|nr:hypothetical protein [Candidatus Dependentiae bacterium]
MKKNLLFLSFLSVALLAQINCMNINLGATAKSAPVDESAEIKAPSLKLDKTPEAQEAFDNVEKTRAEFLTVIKAPRSQTNSQENRRENYKAAQNKLQKALKIY